MSGKPTKAVDPIQSYLNRYEQLKPGFIVSKSLNFPEPLSGDGQPPYWELRISVLPNPENLTDAAKALAPILIKAGVEFKIYKVDGNDQNLANWDGTQSGEDRDQRGKEVCIFMPLSQHVNSNKQYIPYHDNDKLKQLMLDCWKALINNKVQIGYYRAPLDKPIHLETGEATPFSYAAFKPYAQRRGILHEEHFNPINWTDPLANVVLTRKDLKKTGINSASAYINIMTLRNEYFVTHTQWSSASIDTKLSNIRQAEPENTSVEEAFVHLQNDLTNDAAWKATVGTINATLPMLSQGQQEALIYENWIYYLLECPGENVPGLIETKKIETIQRIKDERDAIRNEYIDSWPLIESLQLPHMPPSLNECLALIDAHPRKMQALYPRLIHLSREFKSDHLYIEPEPAPRFNPTKYIIPAALVLTGLALCMNFIVCVDTLAGSEQNMLDHVGGKWTMVSTTGVAATASLALFVGNFSSSVKKDDSKQTKVNNFYVNALLTLLCGLQTGMFALGTEPEAAGIISGAVISILSAIVLFGSAVPADEKRPFQKLTPKA